MSDSDEGKSVVSYDSRVTTDSSARSHKNDGTNVNSDDRSSNYSRYCPVRCTICSKQINPFFGNDLCCHPFLDVIVCRRCFKFLTNDSWTLGEDGKEEHCCWCGEGGEIFVCDYCPKGICKMCLRKNLGRGYVSKLEQNIDQDEQFAWHCLACDAKDIKSFQLNHEKTVQMVNEQRSRRQKSATAAAAAKKTPSAPSADDDDGNPQSSLAILKRRVEGYEKLYADAERNGQSLKTAEFLAPLVDIGAEFCRSLKRIKTMARREQEQEDFRGYDDAACPESALKVRQAIHHVTDGLIVASSFYERVLQTHRVEETKLDATRSERKSLRRRKRSNGGSGGKAERIPSDVINQHFQDAIDSLTTGKSDIPKTIDPPVADSTAMYFSVIELDQSRSSDESDSRRAHKHEASDAVARSIVDAPLTALDIRDETARTVADYKFIRGTVSKFDPAPKIDFNEDCNKEKKRVRSKTTASKSSSATATKSLSESAIENYAQENRIRDGTNKGTESIHSAKRRAWKSEPDDDDCVSDLNTDQPIVVNNDKRLRLSDDLITVDLLDAGLTVDSVHGVAKNKIAPADREKKRRASDDASESADGNDDDASKSSDCPLDVFNLNEDAGDVIGGQEKSAKNSIASRKIKRGRDRVSDDNASLTGDDGLDEQLKRADRLLRSMNNALGVGAGRKSSSKEQGKKSGKKRQNVIKDTSSTDDMDLGDDDFETRDLKDEVTNAWSEIECPAEGSFKGFIDSRISLDQKPKSYSSDSSDSSDTELLASSEAKKMATTRQMKRKALGEEEGQQLSVVDGVAAEEIISTSDDVATVAKSKFDTNVDKLLKIRLSVRLDDIGKIKDAKKINGDALPATKRRHAKAIVVSSSSNDNDENKNDSLTTSDEEDDDNDDFKPRSNRRLDRRPKVGGDADDDVDDDADNDDEDDDADFNVRKTRGDRNGVKRRRESSSTTSQDDDDSDVVVVGGRRRRGGGGKAKKAGGSRGRPRRRVAVSTDEEMDDDPANASKTGRTNIRKIQKASALQLDAYEEEKERRRRINEKQKIYNEMSASQEASTSAIPTECTSLVLDRHEETKDVLVEVHPSICKRLKPHQVEGVRFMYQCTVESVEKAESAGTGCILAHCMGLGKTFQVVAYLHTLLTHERLKTKTALVLAPLNVVLNWEHEFKHWLEDEDEELSLNIWELASVKNNEDRAKTVDTWQENGGVLILSYNLFLMLVDDSDKAKKKIKKEKWRQSFLKGFLDPGPDVVVCDEGHMLKNEKTGISKAVNKIRTLRRICLTGTPLQNNLKEYYTMVQFVKPNLLGTRLEFSNRFENPIKNGQYQDSTQADVRLMKKRAHILHEMLSGCVQRQNYTALSTALPPKYEYVLSISLSEEQIKLYQKYLTEVVVSCDAQSLKERRGLFADYQALQRIWTHPYALLLHTEKMDVKERLQEEKDFVVSGDSDSSEFSVYADADVEVGEKKKSNKDSNSNENDEDTKSNEQNNADDDDVEVIKPWKTRTRDGTTKEPVADNFADMPKLPSENQDWYGDAVTEEAKQKLEISGKIFLLFEIIRKCEAIGDKLLVFSQSLVALDIIENFLEFYQKNGWTAGVDSLSSLYGWKWRKDKDYFRLDGSTPAERRKALSKIFNDPANLRSRLFLISTRAGSLGMNLFGANRVVIFDTNWNPTHDTQSMFRVYRFGQTKPVYVYRFIAHGTMEAKIYERGVTKQSLACRVVDEQQIDRHFLGKDLEALYEFTPKSSGKEKLTTLAVPKVR